MAFLRQTWTLTGKNLKIVVLRHSLTTVIMAFVLPIILAVFFSYARNFIVSNSYFKISWLFFFFSFLARDSLRLVFPLSPFLCDYVTGAARTLN